MTTQRLQHGRIWHVEPPLAQGGEYESVVQLLQLRRSFWVSRHPHSAAAPSSSVRWRRGAFNRRTGRGRPQRDEAVRDLRDSTGHPARLVPVSIQQHQLFGRGFGHHRWCVAVWKYEPGVGMVESVGSNGRSRCPCSLSDPVESRVASRLPVLVGLSDSFQCCTTTTGMLHSHPAEGRSSIAFGAGDNGHSGRSGGHGAAWVRCIFGLQRCALDECVPNCDRSRRSVSSARRPGP